LSKCRQVGIGECPICTMLLEIPGQSLQGCTGTTYVGVAPRHPKICCGRTHLKGMSEERPKR